MTRAHGYTTAALLVAGLLFAMPGPAASQDRIIRYQRGDQTAYDNGFREGLAQGERDAREGREFSFVRSEMYRLADDGYRREDGDLGDYRRMFRQGFEAGYREGFEHDARGITSYRRGTVTTSPAAQIGFEDGYDAALNDIRHHEAYDPVRSEKFRSADHHYDRKYGSKQEFQREYRRGFEDGYERAYRGR